MNRAYDERYLAQYPFFENLCRHVGLQGILDPLTGVISRSYMIGFAESLIADQVSFSYAILDLDNFKFINDTYGHSVGDLVLMDIAANMADFLRGYGVVGRFGGDEFLIINFRDLEYDDKKSFFVDFYTSGKVLRKKVFFENRSIYVTGTTGCATFPNDANTYDGLFALMDKTLYRGKSKGRNCYIIYLESKHKDTEIRKGGSSGIYVSMHSLIRQFEFVPGLYDKLHSIMPLLKEILRISDLYYTGRQMILRGVLDSSLAEDVSDLDCLTSEDLYYTNNLEKIKDVCPKVYAVLKKRNIETVMVTRIRMEERTYGFLVLAEPRSLRIWQEEECAVMFFLSKMIAAHIRIKGEELL
ncbi:MAG: GGDEF domain-containing protein [Lachnospiraceae bacterium]|nr:GGDEF domain-containing protein [Lachnospiraceae bacterium]